MQLLEDEWNTLLLRLEGDRVKTVLNDQELYRPALAAGEFPRFGIFHFADRTEAKVRNVVWRASP